MCGFIGVISKNGREFDQKKLKEMTNLIHHRGPDDEGFFNHENWLNLSFKRLSILDLSKQGHQPMVAQDEKFAIVFNGEVYNYLEIREELKQKGHVFKSNTDTEVVLNAYREWGEACMSKFIGMFAFIAVDLVNRDVFVVRDPLGIKPLFYFEDEHFLVITSEVKCLLPYVSLQPNYDSINEYLVFRSVIGKHTLFKNVNNVRPGYCLKYKNNHLQESQYFNLANTLNPVYGRDFKEICDEVEQTLIDSIKLHLRSDVELGVQLSGGVDSSLITAIASQNTGKKFHTFSISFPGSPYDESKYQKIVSEKYNTEHHDYPLDNETFTSIFNKSIWHYEHPLNDPNSVATLYLTKLAKEYITVMLSGEGADESFLGYARFNYDSVARLRQRTFLYRHPHLRELLWKTWPIQKGKSIFNITRYNPAMYVLSYADLNDTHKLLNGNDDHMSLRRQIIKSAEGNTLNEAMLTDQICDLLQWFWRADRMGMASSMELRVPFCTVPMFKLANSIPYEQRVFLGERKAILKKVAENYIGHEQIYRKKIGFGTPVDEWLNVEGAFKDLYETTMESKEFKNRDFINHAHFNDFYERHKKGLYVERNSGYMWTYFNLESWYRIFFENGWKSLI